MKKNLLVVLFATFVVSAFGQTSVQGTFSDDRDTLKFRNDSVAVLILSNGGLVYRISGQGEYSLTEDVLIIKTSENSNKSREEKTRWQIGDTKYVQNETIVFKIIKQTESILTVVLLGICSNEDYNGRKTVKRFERDHKKYIYRRRELVRKN